MYSNRNTCCKGALDIFVETHDDHMLMLGVYVSEITTHATTTVLYSYQNTTTIKAIELYYIGMITTEAYIVG
jgi:hypothetical protein